MRNFFIFIFIFFGEKEYNGFLRVAEHTILQNEPGGEKWTEFHRSDLAFLTVEE